MNVLDTVIAAEKKADDMIAVTQTESQTALETARKAQVEALATARTEFAEAEATALAQKEAGIEKTVQTIKSETATEVANIEKNFAAKKDAAIEAVKKYFG